MIKVYSKALSTHIEVDRFIESHHGKNPGATLVFFAGIHGNEPAGVFALERVFKEIKELNLKIRGNVYAISGNLSALEQGIRFEDIDLNRVWTQENIENLNSKKNHLSKDVVHQKAIYDILQELLIKEDGPFYFFDLHTTSSKTIPFLTINDSLINRKFTKQYPVPIILGIEEYLDGALLSYINSLGYIAFGFEGGQHDDLKSIENHIAFIYLSLVFAGSLEKSEIKFQKYFSCLNRNTKNHQSFYEIWNRYEIKSDEQFEMVPGFKNFQSVKKDIHIASTNGEKIFAPKNIHIFMPLYQGKGNDGFFMIRRIPKVFLRLSMVLRRIKFDRLLSLLPGVRWDSKVKDELVVNLKLAPFFSKQFFHLLGYRSKQIDRTHLRMKNRESTSRKKDYKNTPWMQK